jgi:hypothetical protein
MADLWLVNTSRYLGDGVYVSHDGYQLWLHVEGRPSVALDGYVYMELRSIGDEFFSVVKTEKKEN